VGDDTGETDQAETERQLKLSAESPAILDLLITRGIALGASDIHVQSNGHAGTVRYRVDGVLQAGPHLSLDGLASVLGRAKAVGGMDPSVRIRPQDGRGAMKVGHTVYDLRFSTLPSSGSESLVVRLLAQGGLLALESYGADPHSMTRLRQGFLDQTSGIFIVTGPTGSGKTTLLYSLLGELNDGRRHIHTVEDPVEIQLEGLAQVQINRRAGLTFEAAIRSLMRQDPDVILVSETRDPETARAVTDAAMTGHLVSTTLHTIDAATALPRLRDLKVDPRELAQVLSGISAQRLLRTLCTECREPVTDAAGPMEEWFADLAGFLPAYRSVGCDKCDSSGYAGRFPAVEVLLTDDALIEAFMQGASHHQLRHIAQLGGMRTMAEIVADRARQGDTDVAEIRRVMGSDLLTADTIRRPETPTPHAPTNRVDSPILPNDSISAASDVLLISSDNRSRVIVEEGLHSVGLTLHMENDIPTAAVWTEIHNPRLVILDVQHEGEGAVRRLRDARDAFLALLPHMSVIVLAPTDDAPFERILLEHDLGDYLRAPLTPGHVGFLTDQVLRRAEVRAGVYA
jgi:type II secretory ATPase GspE/PulE/Tfp pilus assembly ATPase PilB-like protein